MTLLLQSLFVASLSWLNVRIVRHAWRALRSK